MPSDRWPGLLSLGPVPKGPDDIQAIKATGVRTVMCLMEASELASLGRDTLHCEIAAAGLQSLHAPIPDYQRPDAAFLQRWEALSQHLVNELDAGRMVLVHCQGGRGRSGMVTAALLTMVGTPWDEAVNAIRSVRPGAIETPDQEAWLREIKPLVLC